MYFYFLIFISHFSFTNMPYSQFTSIHTVRQQLGLKVTYRKLFPDIEEMLPSEFLSQTLARATADQMAYFSEKSRSEAIVFPILNELRFVYENRISLYSGATIEGDKNKGLNGECDFVLSQGEQGMEVEKPIFCVVEAKDNDLSLGMPQCIAQLVGARLFNEKDGFEQVVLYGCVTTGTNWLFLKIENELVTIDKQGYSLAKLPELLGALQCVITTFIDK